jgi:hypothetical protein
MSVESLSVLSDAEVMAGLAKLLREERRLTASVLVHLGEVEARKLHLAAACASMHVYCTRVLGMSEDQAFKRIRAARAVRRFPVVAKAVADGRLHLIGVVLLSPHLTADNVEELVAEASGKRKAEIEVLLARRYPRPDVPPRLERLACEAAQVAARLAPSKGGLAPEPVGSIGGTAKVAPLAAGRFALQVTIGETTREKLLRARGLLLHQVPSGDLSQVLDWVLDAALEKLEKTKFGKTFAPRKARASRAKGYVPHEARRQAVERDGMRCSFVSDDGRRCEETGLLELDHVVPVSLGGDATDGVRILCRAHNRFEAERILGCTAVEAGKAARARRSEGRSGARLRWTAQPRRSATGGAPAAVERIGGVGEEAAEDRGEAELVARAGEEVVLEDRGLLLDAVIDEVAAGEETVLVGAGVAAAGREEGADGAGDDIDADRGLPDVSDLVDEHGAPVEGGGGEVVAVDGVGRVDGVAQRHQGARAL